MKNKKIFIFTLILTIMLATKIDSTFADSKSIFPSGNGIVTIVNSLSNGSHLSITFDGRYFKIGDQVHVYSDSAATHPIGATPMPFNQYLDDVVIQINPQAIPQVVPDVSKRLSYSVGQSSGSLYVTLSDVAGDAESDPVKVDYGQEVTVASNVDVPDTATFKGLVKKDVAKVYAKDRKTVLGTATAAADGDVVVSLSKHLIQIPQIQTPVGVEFMVYVTVKNDGKAESDKTPVVYTPAAISVHPVGNIAVAEKAADIVVTNNLTEPDTVTFLNLKAKDVATVYAPDEPTVASTYLKTTDSTIIYATTKASVSTTTSTTTYTTVLGTATATKDGNVVIKLAKQLSESNKIIYVSVKNYNLFESSATLVKYYRAGQTPNDDSSSLATTITPSTYNAITTSNMIFVSGVSANDTVTVYDSGTNKLIGIGTVASGNNYVIVNFISTSHSIYLKNKNADKLISDSSSLITLP